MPLHEFIIVERLPKCRVAFYKSQYPSSNVTNAIDIGPLFPLFFRSAQKTCQKETGRIENEESIKLWMGPTRFHLPPTIRWICKLELKDGQPSQESLEVWMAVSDRVVLGEHADTKTWTGGVYASVESGFNTTVSQSWVGLQKLLVRHGLAAIGQEVLVENFQATNHGGWDRYRIMIEIDTKEIDALAWKV